MSQRSLGGPPRISGRPHNFHKPPAKPYEKRGLEVTLRFDEARPISDLAVTRTAVARILRTPPRIDGRLGDPAWRRAARLKWLCRVGTAAPAAIRTEVRVGYFRRFLYVSVQCDEPDAERRSGVAARFRDSPVWERDSVHILLDSRKVLRRPHVVVVAADGSVADYRVSGAQKDLNWDSRCYAAAAPNRTGWAVELKIPRDALDDPDNDLIGFNVVRRRPGTEGEPFSWNPTLPFFERGGALGNLAFERRPCSIRKVELGRPRVGRNRFRVWIRNSSGQNINLPAGLVTRGAGGRVDKSRYRFTLPAERMVAYIFSHRISAAGACDLAFALVDDGTGEPLAQCSRSGLRVLDSALTLAVRQATRTEEILRVPFSILLPRRELSGVGLTAMVRETGGFRTRGKGTVRQAPSRSGEIVIPVGELPEGPYRLDAYLSREGKILGRARMEFSVPAAPSQG